MDTTQLLYFVRERETIRLRRAAGQPQPWTDDPILRAWSFTNVRREDDRVTRWIAANWREPHADDPDLWFAMVVARFVNWPNTLSEIGYPAPWDPEKFLAVMRSRAERGDQLYGPAYMIRADSKNPGRATAEYQAAEVFKPLWKARGWMSPKRGDTLAKYFGRLKEFHGMGGGFMPAQIVADIKFVKPLLDAPDWTTFAASGPGSRRGLNRVLGRPKDSPWSEESWRSAFARLREVIAPELVEMGLGDLDAQSLQSCLCELDKMERVRLGEGSPRRRFVPSTEPLPAPALGRRDTVCAPA